VILRFNGDIQVQTGCAEVSVWSSIHDIKFLLLRFAEKRSFSEETHGGGKESNMQLVACILGVAVYVLTSTKQFGSLRNYLNGFIDARSTDWYQSAYTVRC